MSNLIVTYVVDEEGERSHPLDTRNVVLGDVENNAELHDRLRRAITSAAVPLETDRLVDRRSRSVTDIGASTLIRTDVDSRTAANTALGADSVARAIGIARATPRPLVIVVRNPDAANDITVFGVDADVIDIDLGYMNLADPEEFKQWVSYRADEARTIAFPEAVALYQQVVENEIESHGHPSIDWSAPGPPEPGEEESSHDAT